MIKVPEEVVNDKTLIAVSDGIEVNIVVVVAEEEEGEPGLEGVDWNDEQDPHDPPLLGGV